ncbi:hypothetical protein Tco_1292823 [Tanacetum coccineum]
MFTSGWGEFAYNQDSDLNKPASVLSNGSVRVLKPLNALDLAYVLDTTFSLVRSRYGYTIAEKNVFCYSARSKLSLRSDGPFKVLEKVNDNVYKIDLPGNVSTSCNVADLQPYFDPDEPLSSFRTNSSEDGEDDRQEEEPDTIGHWYSTLMSAGPRSVGNVEGILLHLILLNFKAWNWGGCSWTLIHRFSCMRLNSVGILNPIVIGYNDPIEKQATISVECKHLDSFAVSCVMWTISHSRETFPFHTTSSIDRNSSSMDDLCQIQILGQDLVHKLLGYSNLQGPKFLY